MATTVLKNPFGAFFYNQIKLHPDKIIVLSFPFCRPLLVLFTFGDFNGIVNLADET